MLSRQAALFAAAAAAGVTLSTLRRRGIVFGRSAAAAAASAAPRSASTAASSGANDPALRVQWEAACLDASAAAPGLRDASVVDRWWRVIDSRYGHEPQRAYHTLNHLTEMLGYVNDWRSRGAYDAECASAGQGGLERPTDAVLATFFHDVIYDPKSGTNEEDSAELWADFSRETGVPDDTRERVYDWIVKTKKHAAGPDDHPDLKRFLDADMAILGQPWDAYFAYALQIRHEYIHVPLDTYCKVRSDFMSAFAVQERIYATDEMRDRFEATARSNVARECKVLRAVIGAGKGDGGDADVSEDLVEAVRSAT